MTPMYVLKEKPEDFIVREVFTPRLNHEGKYAIYVMEKTNYTTADAVAVLARLLGIDQKYFNYCGFKDRNAVTSQYISVSKGPTKDIAVKDLSLKYIGQSEERLALGMLEKNGFVITVRTLDANFSKEKINKTAFAVNYFDEQRFSTHNVVIGLALLKEDFEKAARLVIETNNRLRKECEEYLASHPRDFIGMLRKIQKNVLTMYIHAVQSYLFNEVASELMKRSGLKTTETKYSLGSFWFTTETPKEEAVKKKIQLPSFDYETEDSEVDELYAALLQKHGLTTRSFIIRKIPEITPYSDYRSLFFRMEDLTIGEAADDELHIGKEKIVLSFTLQKGSYATIAVKHLLCAL